jgi:hypothetical protein
MKTIVGFLFAFGAAGLLGGGQPAKADDAVQESQTLDNMKQVALGLLNYESAHGSLPAHASYSADGKPLLSWRVLILPYLEQKSLYDEFHLDEPWDSPHNKPLVGRMPEIFKNPNLPSSDGKTIYLAVVGPTCVFDGTAEGMPLAKITDGTANTVMLVEANADHAVEWTKPADLEFNAKNPAAGLGGLRHHGWNAASADGSCSFIRNETDPREVKALFTPAGGEGIDRR